MLVKSSNEAIVGALKAIDNSLIDDMEAVEINRDLFACAIREAAERLEAYTLEPKHKLNIKPLSVNEAWQGKRYKTQAHRRYRDELHLLLPTKLDIPEGKLTIFFEFGLSNKRADYDNIIKPLQDEIATKYGFDDSRIYSAIIRKVDVKKGQEYVKFNITGANE